MDFRPHKNYTGGRSFQGHHFRLLPPYPLFHNDFAMSKPIDMPVSNPNNQMRYQLGLSLEADPYSVISGPSIVIGGASTSGGIGR